MPDIATLGIAVDATQADTAAAKLDNLTQAGARAEAQTEKLGVASGATAAEIDVFQQKAVAAAIAQTGMTEAQARATLGFTNAAAAANAGSAAVTKAGAVTTDYAARADKLRASLDPLAKSQQMLAVQTAELNALVEAGAITTAEYTTLQTAAGKAAEAAASSMTHAAGATSTVTRETLVLGREALRGNWTRMAGSATILAQAMGVLSYALSPVAIGIELVTAAIIGGFVAAGNYNAALQATNDLAAGVGVTVGLTGDAIRNAAEAGSTAANVSIGAARKQAEVYAQTGKISADVMTALIGDTERYAQATGQKAAQASKDLAAAFADPAKGAEELDSKLNFLTATQLQNIETMAKSGDRLGAQRELMKDFEVGLDGLKTKTDFWSTSLKIVGDNADAAFAAIARLFSYNPAQNDLDYSGFPGSSATPGVQAKNAAAAAAAAKTAAAQDRAQVKAGFSIAQQYDLGGAKQQLDLEQQLAQVELSLAAARKTNSDQTGSLTVLDEALTRAVTSYVSPAQKAHDIALANLAVTNAITPAQKGAAAAALVRAKAEGEVVTQAQLNQQATDAARQATDKKADSSRKHAETLAAEAAALKETVAGLYASADAYLQSSAAGEREAVITKATAEAIKAKLNPAQTAVKIADELNKAAATAAESGAKQSATLTDQANSQDLLNASVEAGSLSYAAAAEQQKINLALLPLLNAMNEADAAGKAKLAIIIDALRASYEHLNKTNADSKLDQQLSQLGDQNQLLERQLQLANASVLVRAQQLAQLKAEQDLLNNPSGPQKGSVEGNKYIAAQVGNATLGVQSAASQNSNEKYRTDYANFLGDIQRMTQDATNDMSASFGNVGNAFGNMVNAMATHSKTQADIQAKLDAQVKAAQDDKINGAARVQLAQTSAADQSRAADLKYYGDSASSFASMFGQKTAAYQVLTTAETIFHALEMANALESMAVDAAKTGETIIQSGLRTAVKATEAVVTAIKDLPFPLNLAAGAATIGFIASLGIGLAGHSGSSSTGANDAQTRQAAQGTGTISGDASAKSSSLANSLSNAEKYQNTDLQYQSQMVGSLKSIENNIGSLTNLLARSLNISSGALNTSSLNLGFHGSKPTLGNFGTSSSTTNTLQDQGLQFLTQSLSSAISSGVSAAAYDQIQTEKKSSFLGITTGDHYSVNTNTNALDSQTAGAITKVLQSLKSGVLSAAGTLGVQGAEATIDAFQISLGKVSLKGMTGQQIQDTLNNVFSSLADSISAAILPTIDQFQKAGEGAFETLARLATDYTTVDTSLQSIGMSFNAVGLSSVAARENLISLVGGVDKLVSETQAFTQDFLTAAEAIAPVATAVKTAMGDLGYSSIVTKNQFVALVQSIDVTSAAGAQLYASLMAVAPAFAKVADYNTQAIQDAANAQINIINGIAQATQTLQQQYQGFVTSIAAYKQSILSSTGNIAQNTAYAHAVFQQTAAGAASSNLTSLGNLQGDAQTYLDTLKNTAGSLAEYNAGQTEVINALTVAQNAAQGQVDIAQETLNTANAQLDALNAIAGNTQSTTVSIATLVQAQAALANAIANPVKAQTANDNYTPTTPTVDVGPPQSATSVASYTSTHGDYAAYVAQSADLIAGFNDPRTGFANPVFKQTLINAGFAATMAGFGQYQWEQAGQYQNRSVRPFRKGGVFTNGIVSQPTTFDMGLMGEDNPEAIMPLVKGPNGLGVRSSGSDAGLKSEVQAMRTEMQAGMIAIAKNTMQVAKLAARWETNGVPVRNPDPTQPIQVHSV